MNDEATKKDPKIQEIEAEITETRERLAGNLDELKDRVSPENVAQAAKEKVIDMAQDATRAMKDGVMNAAQETAEKAKRVAVRARDGAIELAGDVGSGVRRGAYGFGRAVRDNPVPAAIAAAGIGYLVYKAITDGRESGDRPMLTSGPDAGSEDEATGVKEKASALADRAMEGGQRVARMARESGQKAKRGTQDAFTKHPLIFGLGAFVVGLAVGAMVPGTNREDELMGEQRDRFLREAKSRAHDAGEVAKEAARKAVDHVDRALPSIERPPPLA